MAKTYKKAHFERFEEQRLQALPKVEKILKAHPEPSVELVVAAATAATARPGDGLIGGAAVEAAIEREIGRMGGKPSYMEVTQRMVKTGVHRAVTLSARGNLSEISTVYMQQWQIWRFTQAGERVYDVSPGLASRAAKTELRGISADYLLSPGTLPYDSIYLMVPPEAGLEVENVLSGTHVVEGIYITTDRLEGVDGWRLMVVGLPKRDMWDDALFHFFVPLVPGQSLDDTASGAAEPRGRPFEQFNEAELKCLRLLPGLFRWTMNVVLYATSAEVRQQEVWNHPDAEKLLENARKHPKGHKRDRAKAALQAARLRKRTYLGGGISVLMDLPDARGTGKGLIVRTLVQGHWRNQAHGPGHSLRKLLWITPFWRGPEDGEVSAPLHKVG